MIEHLRRLGRPAAMTTVAERLRPDALFQRFLAYRRSLGFEVLAADERRHRTVPSTEPRGCGTAAWWRWSPTAT